jgi:Ca-activated chloride channel family protein
MILRVAAVVTLVAGVSFAEAPSRVEAPYFEVLDGDPALDALPLKETRVHSRIVGVIAHVTVTQVYFNDGARTLNVRYVFPGSTRAAVHGLVMQVGDRRVRAQVKEKVEAQRQFDEAKAQGKTATLLTESRPNVFTMSLANVLPKDRLEVTLEYSELLIPERGTYEWVFPTVVGPRYVNGSESNAAFANAPYQHAGEAPHASFSLDATLSAGMPIQSLTSPSHRLTSTWEGKNSARFSLTPDASAGNRDVVVRYSLLGASTASGLLLSEGGDENFFLLTVQPPARVAVKDIPPRDYLFVVDTSGSMYGFPLQTTKTLLHDLVSQLRPIDTFNVLFFSGGSQVLSPKPLAANAENLARAEKMISTATANGGTELLPALEHAMSLPRQPMTSRSVVVITDGYVGCEREAFTLIRGRLNQANLFAFGIGSSVNRTLIEGLAHAGRGEPFFVLAENEASEQAERFRRYIQTPVLTGVSVRFDGFETSDLQPAVQPDVFAEKPIVVIGKWRGPRSGTITVSGSSAHGPWSHRFSLSEVAPKPEHEALKWLWARERVRSVSDFAGGAVTEDERKTVTSLGLTYGLLTPYTSFIAVLEQVRATERGTDVDQPLPMPAGVADLAVGDSMERGDEPEALLLVLALVLAMGLTALHRRRSLG